jgi:hypothetical protein
MEALILILICLLAVRWIYLGFKRRSARLYAAPYPQRPPVAPHRPVRLLHGSERFWGVLIRVCGNERQRRQLKFVLDYRRDGAHAVKPPDPDEGNVLAEGGEVAAEYLAAKRRAPGAASEQLLSFDEWCGVEGKGRR